MNEIIKAKIERLKNLQNLIDNVETLAEDEEPMCICTACKGKGMIKTSTQKKAIAAHEMKDLGFTFSEMRKVMGVVSKSTIHYLLSRYYNQ